VLRQQALAKYTAARLGGNADFLVIGKDPDFADTLPILQRAWDLRMPVTIIGGGANILVSDRGVRGLTIINRATTIVHERQGNTVSLAASSGTNLIRLTRYCQEHGIGGLEWAIGVPGTVGGAVVNNAGAHGSDVAASLQRAQVFEADAGKRWMMAEELQYTYRHSSLKSRRERRFLVLGAVFTLERAAPDAIQERMDAANAYRKRTQPTGASLGSIFKNPPDDYAGRLIESAGLKGYRVGGVQVSPVHANFFVNVGEDASAHDYRRLIDHVRQGVRAAFGIELELEIEMLGDWD
jgi:UDP-N-acetylmuramate dehydrogenase